MDPLSVAASIVGLLDAGVKISSSLYKLVHQLKDAPLQARQALQEVTDISHALGSLRTYVFGDVLPDASRGSLILLEHVLTTLTGCVTTYSELQKVLDETDALRDDIRLFDRVRWLRHQGRVTLIVQQLQYHKSSMTLMLSILQCNTLKEAEVSNRRLCSLVEEVLKSNADLASRIKGLEREGTIYSQSQDDDGTESIMLRAEATPCALLPNEDYAAIETTFEQDLAASRVYSRNMGRHSMSSLSTTARLTTALSIFSKLSLSQVSFLSFYALPIYVDEICNAEYYVFGSFDDTLSTYGAEPHITAESSRSFNSDMKTPPAPTIPVRRASRRPIQIKPRGSPRPRRILLGRYARTRPTISCPEQPMHVTHVSIDSDNRFSGLPKAWQRMLEQTDIVDMDMRKIYGREEETIKVYFDEPQAQDERFENPRSAPQPEVYSTFPDYAL